MTAAPLQLTFAFKDDIIKKRKASAASDFDLVLRNVRLGILRAEEIKDYRHIVEELKRLVSPIVKIIGILTKVEDELAMIERFINPTRYVYTSPSKEEVIHTINGMLPLLARATNLKAENFTEKEQKRIFGLIIVVDNIEEKLKRIIRDEEDNL